MLSWHAFICKPSLSKLAYFNLHSDHFQIQISSPDLTLELPLCTQALASRFTWLSHIYPKCIFATELTILPSKPTLLVLVPTSSTQCVIKPNSQQASPTNQSLNYFLLHILHHKPSLTLLHLLRTYFPPFFSQRLIFPSNCSSGLFLDVLPFQKPILG